ncbi:MAG: MlaD family protein [Solirubrobacterales bacterium]
MRRQGVADNPVLVGAGAILVILVMVLLSYNANTGLPFVPTYNITADLPNGAALVKGNDVRIGGARAGLVTAITPQEVDGEYYAKIDMKLDQNVGPIPANSKVEVRPRSTIGLKYVELTLGDSKQTIPNGGSLPIGQATVATEFEDLLNTFDERVREGNKNSLTEFGNAFAGRGTDLNTAFGELGPLFANLEPVARTISARSTRLSDFIRALARAARDTAATGDEAGEVFVNADRTLGAFAAASQGIQDSLEESPPTLAVLTESFPDQQRYFTQLTEVVEKFQPGAPYLPAVADNLATITTRGPKVMRKLYRTTPKFNKTFQNLGQFSADPQVRLGFQGLASFVSTINQPLSYVTPAQTVCNYFGLFARNIASAVSSRDGGYGWLRFSAVAGYPNPVPGANSEVGPASGLANFDARNQFGEDTSNFLQSNPTPTTGQNKICGAGNEITKGSTRDFNTAPRLPKEVRVGQPTGIKGGSTTEDTKAVESEQIKK